MSVPATSATAATTATTALIADDDPHLARALSTELAAVVAAVADVAGTLMPPPLEAAA